jgi:GNAT superfamily N-acetyltransferase
MRVMSRLGGIIDVLNRTTGEFDDYFGGFVWVEDGKVVGNITVQRADKYGNRWQIANVAVAPMYRGRGLSRRMMETALDHIGEHGGKWVVLQVYAQNSVARTLYDHLGFQEMGGLADLEAPVTPKYTRPTGQDCQLSLVFGQRLAAPVRAGQQPARCTGAMVASNSAQRFSGAAGAAVQRMAVALDWSTASLSPLHPVGAAF